jgi:hypothetical protein
MAWTTPSPTTGHPSDRCPPQTAGPDPGRLSDRPTHQFRCPLIDELVDGLDARSMSEHERHGRVQTWQYLKAFRRHLHGFSDAYLIQTGPQLGIRESRHLVARTQVTRDDVIHARNRPDEVIALCGWPIEDHRGGPGKTA